jgi:hypothetical protein
MLSIFLSDLIRELAAGRRFRCPVAADAPSWWMSRPCIVDNLLHAAAIGREQLVGGRTFLMPVLRASCGEVVSAIAAIYGSDVLKRVEYVPDAKLQAQFANYPPMHAPRALGAGFKSDGTLEQLVRRALEGL